MALVKYEDSTNLWAGVNNEQVKGDDMPVYKAFPLNIRNWKSKVQYPVTTTTPVVTTPVVTTPVTQPDALTAVKNFISNNKLMVLGGAALIIYLLFFASGGGLSEKVVSMRYFGKK